MSEEERFYSTAENKIKECHIMFPDLPPEGESEEPIKTCIQEVTLDLDALKDLEN